MSIIKLAFPQYKKSQGVMADLVLSIFVIAALLLFLFSVLTRYSSLVNQRTYFSELEMTAIQVLDLLVETPGTPSNWEYSPDIEGNTYLPGLVSYNRYLSKPKIKAFLEFDDDALKEKFHVKRYDFYFGIKKHVKDDKGKINEVVVVDEFIDSTGLKTVTPLEKMGCRPSQSAKDIISVRRKALYNNEVVIVELLLWPVGDSIC